MEGFETVDGMMVDGKRWAVDGMNVKVRRRTVQTHRLLFIKLTLAIHRLSIHCLPSIVKIKTAKPLQN